MEFKQTRKYKGNHRSVTGFVSYRNFPLPFESTLERDFLTFHTFYNDVLDITPQPVSIPFVKNGRTYHYTPDYFIQYPVPRKSLMVEVKPYDEWRYHWRDWSEKWKAAIAYCRKNGFVFRIYDESRIRHTGWQNVKFLQTYQSLNVDMQTVLVILKQIELMGHTTVEYILELWFKGSQYRTEGRQIMWYLMANKMVGFNIWHNNLPSEKIEIWHLPVQSSLDWNGGGLIQGNHL